MSYNSFALTPLNVAPAAPNHDRRNDNGINTPANDAGQKEERNSQTFTVIPIPDTESPSLPTLVAFSHDDKANPKNWSKALKWYCTMIVAFVCFVVAFNSSVVTADITGVSKEYNVSDEVSLLTVTLFVVGFGLGESLHAIGVRLDTDIHILLGPMIFAPLSEVFGRQIVYAGTLVLALIFIIPAVAGSNITTLLVARAIDGIAFSAPMALVGGTLSDLWKPQERGIPMAAFSAAPFIGPIIGPLAGGYLSMYHGWRSLYWMQLALSGLACLLITFTVPETYAPTILARRAAKLRKQNRGVSYTIEQGARRIPLIQRLRVAMVRPFLLLFREPIVFFLSIYMSILYGLMYMFFIAVSMKSFLTLKSPLIRL